MAENTKILWAQHTFNPWIGCMEVGPGCDHCYARMLAERHGWAKWGAKEQRYLTANDNWMKVFRWNEAARNTITDPSAEPFSRRYPRVFCCSLADVFDNAVPPAWRRHLFTMIAHTPYLEWLLLTKRPHNIAKMLPADWGNGYRNVGLMATVCNQEEADRDIPKLAAVPAMWHGLSIEPALGGIDLRPWLGAGLIDWVITGGESGPNARPTHVNVYRSLRDQCEEWATAFLFKQFGQWVPSSQISGDIINTPTVRSIYLDDGAGNTEMHWRLPYEIDPPILDGRTHVEFPEQEMIREFGMCLNRQEKREFLGTLNSFRETA